MYAQKTQLDHRDQYILATPPEKIKQLPNMHLQKHIDNLSLRLQPALKRAARRTKLNTPAITTYIQVHKVALKPIKIKTPSPPTKEQITQKLTSFFTRKPKKTHKQNKKPP